MGCEVPWCFSIKPAMMPELCLISIVDGDGGGGIEKEVIHFIARVIRADTRFSGIHSRDNHRSRRAMLNLSRSVVSRPPKSFGMQIVGQLTTPLVFSSPLQRKEQRILSICFLSQTASGETVRS